MPMLLGVEAEAEDLEEEELGEEEAEEELHQLLNHLWFNAHKHHLQYLLRMLAITNHRRGQAKR